MASAKDPVTRSGKLNLFSFESDPFSDRKNVGVIFMVERLIQTERTFAFYRQNRSVHQQIFAVKSSFQDSKRAFQTTEGYLYPGGCVASEHLVFDEPHRGPICPVRPGRRASSVSMPGPRAG